MSENRKKELIKILGRIADLMDLKGENPFKSRAFRNAANALRNYTGELEALFDKKNPVKIKGIGAGILAVISDFLEGREIRELKRLSEGIPENFHELFEIKGLGIKKIKILREELGIDSVVALEHAIRSGALDSIAGFGEGTNSKILEQIEKLKSRKKFMLISEAETLVENVKNKLTERLPYVKKAIVTGELRRVSEVITKAEILILLDEGNEKRFEEELGNLFPYNKINDYFSLTDFGEKDVRIYTALSKNDFVKKNFILTGNEKFIAPFNLEHEFTKEQEIFGLNNFPYVIPELRERAPDEIHETDSDLCFAEMKGMLHFHTVMSDGMNTLEEMVAKGIEKGFEYFAVCDHSKSAYYANGLDEKRLAEQKEEVATISEKLSVPILHGNETDILPDGSLDFSDEILRELDFVVASVHSRFNLSEEEMTKRIIGAVENPYVVVLGHPTGRLLLRRDSYAVNIRKVIDACAANNVAIEINANPWRLDLDWRNFEYARSKGVLFAINADAHSVEEISYTKFGVKMARKGGITQNEVINYWNVERLRKFIKEKRGG